MIRSSAVGLRPDDPVAMLAWWKTARAVLARRVEERPVARSRCAHIQTTARYLHAKSQADEAALLAGAFGPRNG